MRPSHSRARRLIGVLLVATTLPIAHARKTRLTWVNGIAHNLDHMEEGKDVLQETFGGKRVVYCYNPTAMANDNDLLGYYKDLGQAGTQIFGRITEEVNVLVKHLKEAVEAVGKKGRVIHIAHSQGALITALAAKQLTLQEMNQMEVLCFGGAAAVRRTPQTPFCRCVNYYSVNDPLLFVVPQATLALKSGFVGNEEFCFLSPRLGDPILDHNLIGPTYLQALQWEGRRFQQTHQSIAYRTVRPLCLLAHAFAVAFSARLHALLKMLLRPLLLWCILVWMWTRTMVLQMSQFTTTRVVQPVGVVVKLLIEWAILSLQRWKGEEAYVPVLSNLDPTKEAQ